MVELEVTPRLASPKLSEYGRPSARLPTVFAFSKETRNAPVFE